jgi:hypothetical protein
MPGTATLADRIAESADELADLFDHVGASTLDPSSKFDNRRTWDNVTRKFDNRHTWDNWDKKDWKDKNWKNKR